MIKSSGLVKVALGFSHSTFAKYFTRKQFNIETTITGFGISANSFLKKIYLSFFFLRFNIQ